MEKPTNPNALNGCSARYVKRICIVGDSSST
jgi:hypothetical protein